MPAYRLICALLNSSQSVSTVAVALAILFPVLISIFGTITDEMAESGAAQFRDSLTFRRICANIQWSFAGFYVSLHRGILLANASTQAKDVALFLVFISLLLGLLGAIFIRRTGWLTPVSAALAILIVIVFSRTI